MDHQLNSAPTDSPPRNAVEQALSEQNEALQELAARLKTLFSEAEYFCPNLGEFLPEEKPEPLPRQKLSLHAQYPQEHTYNPCPIGSRSGDD